VGYICAFRGRRDSYQVPAALAEGGLLDLFITDHYCGTAELVVSQLLPMHLSERVRGRHEELIPMDRVRRVRSIAVAEAGAYFSGLSAARIYDLLDPMYGRVAAREARRRRSDLFMYSSYAWEAFCARYRHTPRKILFQFHPHHVVEERILQADWRTSADQGIRFEAHETLRTDAITSRQRGDSAWQLADRIVCASSFTKHSLVEVGVDPSIIKVVPYGVPTFDETPLETPQELKDNRFHALFVGSGLQRKGLHHLILAWRRARLPAGSYLTVASRIVDPGLVHFFQDVDGVHFLNGGITESVLRRLYAAATVFVMPSLVEGFGQVYLEALSHGLPVIGTRNTCLPDLGDEGDGIFLTSPGNIDELAGLLERLSDLLNGNAEIRSRAKEVARRFTWDRFRSSLRELIM
jgi:glycosyltransferase involved in cell wall biosynthesis